MLLNVRRGSRVKPAAVEQVVWRLDRHPAEADQLVPLLSVAMRSLRRPERHAALAAVVRLVERRPDAALLVQQSFPELKWA